jgi:hypothetical protein
MPLHAICRLDKVAISTKGFGVIEVGLIRDGTSAVKKILLHHFRTRVCVSLVQANWSKAGKMSRMLSDIRREISIVVGLK